MFYVDVFCHWHRNVQCAFNNFTKQLLDTYLNCIRYAVISIVIYFNTNYTIYVFIYNIHFSRHTSSYPSIRPYICRTCTSTDVSIHSCIGRELSGPWERGCNLKFVIPKPVSRVDIFSISCEITKFKAKMPHWWLVSIGSVPQGNKPLPKPILAHMALPGDDRLKKTAKLLLWLWIPYGYNVIDGPVGYRGMSHY